VTGRTGRKPSKQNDPKREEDQVGTDAEDCLNGKLHLMRR
jgi:hypothetical protein